MINNNLIDSKFLYYRANTHTRWLATDTIENYTIASARDTNLYSITDIDYKFNKYGFRCDEFTLPSELPIVFLGCSFTEGIGIRQHETWSYKLLEKIRLKTNKNIPYWNLGLAGTSLDTQARHLYFLTTLLNIKVKFVFSLIPHVNRREYKVDSEKYRNWIPNWLPEAAPLSKHVNLVFSDEHFSSHQTERSLMLIDSILRQNDTKMICTSWDVNNDIKTLTNSFPLIDLFQSSIQPNEGDRARDGMHPGPSYHQKLADTYWNHSEKYFVGATEEIRTPDSFVRSEVL